MNQPHKTCPDYGTKATHIATDQQTLNTINESNALGPEPHQTTHLQGGTNCLQLQLNVLQHNLLQLPHQLANTLSIGGRTYPNRLKPFITTYAAQIMRDKMIELGIIEQTNPPSKRSNQRP